MTESTISTDPSFDGSWFAVGIPREGPKGIRASVLIRHGEVIGFAAILGNRGLHLGDSVQKLQELLQRERLTLVRP